MQRVLKSVLLFALALFSVHASALPGIQNVRWKTTYRLGNGAQINADLVVTSYQSALIYPSGSGSADGSLHIDDYQLDDQGRVSSFNGTWNRGGSQGTFLFSVAYQNGYATSINGSYSSAQNGPVMYLWWGSR